MTKKKYIMTFDQGTTSSRCIIFDNDNNIISFSQLEFKQYYPKAGWVEHDAEEIYNTQITAAREAMKKAGLSYGDIAAVGITNQRETTVMWDKTTGKPICNAIVWQCRRSAEFCDELKSKGYEQYFKQKTGLVIDAYFSLTKVKWILDNVPNARSKAEKGELLFGTIDTWLIWNLCGEHITDHTNASRTLMFNITALKWDDEILNEFNIPSNILPQVKPSSCVYGYTKSNIFGGAIPVAGIAGDQQAALFGQSCFNTGDIKNTYGTGCFILMNTGDKIILSDNGLLTTVACGIDGKPCYALEGSIFTAGAAIQWIRDELKVIRSAAESEDAAVKVNDNNGVYMVPAFTGIGAPYWNPYARGIITGLSRGSNVNHIIRAALESIAYQTNDVLDIFEKYADIKIKKLKVDGGACVNNFLMQFQADILNTPIERPLCVESTALGAAYLAGLAVSYYNANDLMKKNRIETLFTPSMNSDIRQNYIKGWHSAVKKALLE